MTTEYKCDTILILFIECSPHLEMLSTAFRGLHCVNKPFMDTKQPLPQVVFVLSNFIGFYRVLSGIGRKSVWESYCGIRGGGSERGWGGRGSEWRGRRVVGGVLFFLLYPTRYKRHHPLLTFLQSVSQMITHNRASVKARQ